MRKVGILPPLVEDAAIRHDLRTPGVLLVARESLHPRAVRVHAEQVRDRGLAGHTGHGIAERRTCEGDIAIGQVTGVVVVDIRIIVTGNLAGLPRLQVKLEDVPGIVLVANRREERTIRIPVQINITDELLSGGAVDLDRLSILLADIHLAERVVVSHLGDHGIALPIVRKTVMHIYAPVNEQDIVEIDGRIVVDHDLPIQIDGIPHFLRGYLPASILLYEECQPHTLPGIPKPRESAQSDRID